MLAQVSSVSHCHCMVSYVVHGLRLEGFAFAVSLFALEIYVYIFYHLADYHYMFNLICCPKMLPMHIHNLKKYTKCLYFKPQ